MKTVPCDWKSVTLADVALNTPNAIADGPFGSNLKVSDYKPEGVPVLQGKNITNDRFRFTDIRFITPAKADELGRSAVREGDLLIVKIGSIGYSAVLDNLNGHDRAVIPANLAKVSIDPEIVDIQYLYRWLTSPEVKRNLKDSASQTAQPALSLAKLKALPVPLPPLDVQRRVASILDHADTLVAQRRAAVALLDTLSQSTFAEMFGDPASNERSYPAVRLADWIDVKRPITYGILKPGPDTEGGVPYVRVADMKEGGIHSAGVRRTTRTIADQYKRSTLRRGDLLMSIRGHVGRFAFVPDELHGANITQDSARLAVSGRDSAVYVRTAMEMPGLQQWMARRTKGAAVRGINLGDLKELPIPCPPKQLQQRFAAAVMQANEQRSVAQSQLTLMMEAFRSLQSRAFSGQL